MSIASWHVVRKKVNRFVYSAILSGFSTRKADTEERCVQPVNRERKLCYGSLHTPLTLAGSPAGAIATAAAAAAAVAVAVALGASVQAGAAKN